MNETPTLTALPVSAIRPSPFQPRKVFDEAELAKLADSIKRHGLQQPIVVRRVGRAYQLIAGERRWRAAKLAALATIPGIVRAVSDQEAAELALIENLQRKDLNPLEEAEAYQRVLDRGQSVEELARAISRSVPYVTYRLALLQLVPEVREAMRRGLLSLDQGHALSFLPAAGQRVACRRLLDLADLGGRKTHRLIAAIRELDRQPALFTLTPDRRAEDAAHARRFFRELDLASQALGRLFERDQPRPLEWVLAVDLRAAAPKLKVLERTLRMLRVQISRAHVRRVAAGLVPDGEKVGRLRRPEKS